MAATTIETAWYSHTSSVQTMRTWSRVLRSYEDIPDVFQTAFPQRESVFPYTVLVPEDKLSFLQKRNERLLCLHEDRVVVMEARRDQVNVTSYRFEDILYAEQGRILLHSWITIGSQSGASVLSFNTVTLHHFQPILETIRRKATTPSFDYERAGNGEKPEPGAFDGLLTRHYKFMNYGRQSLLSGERLLKFVYQPDRCIKTIKLFNTPVFRQYATGHLLILTANELILIRESKRTKTENATVYGGVFTYIPLNKIRNITVTTEPEKSRQVMQIRLSDTICLHSEFGMDNPDVEAFQMECKQAGIVFT